MSESVKAMLTEDINKKKELEILFRRILRGQTVIMVAVIIVAFSALVYAVAYFTKPSHVDEEVVKALNEETLALKKERILLSGEREAARRQREQFYNKLAEMEQNRK